MSAHLTAQPHIVGLHELDLSKVNQGWNKVHYNTNLFDEPLSINGQKYKFGIATHAFSEITLILNGKSERFKAWVGIDDHVAKVNGGSAEFIVKADGKVVFRSGIMSSNQPAKHIDVSLEGVTKLELTTDDGKNGTGHDHANWADAYITYNENQTPIVYYYPAEDFYQLTPKAPAIPRVNGALISAARVGSPYLYRLPVSGEKPFKFIVKNLPIGLSFNPQTQVISGIVNRAGNYKINIFVENTAGKCKATHIIRIGESCIITPPMGWNSWNAWGMNISEDKVKQTIDALISTRLVDFGWSFVNIDDGWQANVRNADSVLMWNQKFNDIPALANYAHQNGLKLGIYSSPGKVTCGNMLGSFGYEKIDAQTYSTWGIDFLKYDWCSYENIIPQKNRNEYIKPYKLMGEELRKQERDIVYSLCQYGMDSVQVWGKYVNGNLWRTTNDIVDTWYSMKTIGFDNQAELAPYSGQGHFNDPDMMVVGKLGWGQQLRNTRLTCNEQYLHVTQWAMLQAPLLLGCVINELDEFTLNLLTNNEIISINQDTLFRQASRIFVDVNTEVWSKELSGNRNALAFYNISNETNRCQMSFEELGLKRVKKFRNPWTQQNERIKDKCLSFDIPRHGVKLLILKQ
jgi:alpha-galactosidase